MADFINCLNNSSNNKTSSISSLNYIPYADQTSLPPAVTLASAAIGISTVTDAGVVLTNNNKMNTSSSFNNSVKSNESKTELGAEISTIDTKNSEDCKSSSNETCVRQRNGNFISWFAKLIYNESAVSFTGTIILVWTLS